VTKSGKAVKASPTEEEVVLQLLSEKPQLELDCTCKQVMLKNAYVEMASSKVGDLPLRSLHSNRNVKESQQTLTRDMVQ